MVRGDGARVALGPSEQPPRALLICSWTHEGVGTIKELVVDDGVATLTIRPDGARRLLKLEGAAHQVIAALSSIFDPAPKGGGLLGASANVLIRNASSPLELAGRRVRYVRDGQTTLCGLDEAPAREKTKRRSHDR